MVYHVLFGDLRFHFISMSVSDLSLLSDLPVYLDLFSSQSKLIKRLFFECFPFRRMYLYFSINVFLSFLVNMLIHI
jgi:hypothetical protein